MEKKYETKIKDYTKDIEQNINQEAVLQTIKKCKETFVQAEDYPLSYMEFLYDQMQFIQKRWWILQGCLLAVLWIFLNDAADIYGMQRLMGAGACLFAIFLVPEIWKIEEIRRWKSKGQHIIRCGRYAWREFCCLDLWIF